MTHPTPDPERQTLAAFIDDISNARFGSDAEALEHGLTMIDELVASRLRTAVDDAEADHVLTMVAYDFLDRRVAAERTLHARGEAEPEQPDPLEGNPHDLAAGEDYDTAEDDER